MGSLPVAVKVLRVPAGMEPDPLLPGLPAVAAGQLASSRMERRLWREVELLRRCTSPYVVQLLGVYVSEGRRAGGGRRGGRAAQGGGGGGGGGGSHRVLMLITELLEGGSLAQRLPDPRLRWYSRCGGWAGLG